MFPRRRARRLTGRYLVIRLIYLLVVAAGAVTLWMLLGDDVKKLIYETYVNPSASP